ncbi:MAG: HutD family protein [Burkholderiales bacterium]|jgi:environmental stress-induced protein Ves|nr:HutD family protein [Burkholderiales bacterium]
MANVLRHSDLPVEAWKNGGGLTSEIAICPVGADLADFDWRISMATIGVDGGFSEFAGIDRSLALVAGKGVNLQFGKGEPQPLLPKEKPLRFAGEAQVYARLLQGEVIDFNVMTRRSRYRHSLRQQIFSLPETQLFSGEDCLLFLAEGESVLCQKGELQFVLKRFDSLYLSAGDVGEWLLVPYGEVCLLVAELEKR